MVLLLHWCYTGAVATAAVGTMPNVMLFLLLAVAVVAVAVRDVMSCSSGAASWAIGLPLLLGNDCCMHFFY